jgi:hypothetical protein
MFRGDRTGERAQQESSLMGRPSRSATHTVIAAVLAVAGCAPQPGVVVAGVGSGPSAPFDAADGAYHVHWSAHDEGATDHGCLAGLSIERTRAANAEAADVRGFRDVTALKLTYRSIPTGGRLVGDVVLNLGAGTYLLRSNGTCGWEAQIRPAGPDESPINGNPRMDNSLEQAG